jgi:hypothetical protein
MDTMLTSRRVWEVLQEHAPRGEWLRVAAIYELVADHVHLDDDDLAKVAATGTSARWQRTVRNALQRGKHSATIEWDNERGFRFADRPHALDGDRTV